MKLVVVEDGARAPLELDRPVVCIGRAVDNDIRLSGSLASRHHCRIEVDGEGMWIVDLGSSNGTQLNGERVDRCRIRRGDVLGVGGARIHVETGPDPGSSAETVQVRGEDGAGYATMSGAAPAGADRLRSFADIARALVRETELAPLLRRIVDSAVKLADGERGFLLFSADEGRSPKDPSELTVRAARTFDGADIPVPSSRLSMGIAGRVLDEGRPVLSVDAGRDERFSAMASVEDLRLRSVMCLPIEIEGRVRGVLYVDNRLQQGVFSEEDLELAELYAGMAAIALRNARLLAELRERNGRLLRSSEEIRSLNERLGRKVRDRDTELAVVRAELGRERGRYDYTAIVGASDGMKQVFQELDRIIETEMPVLIQGESGTGKELIARAIHFNGPRKAKPFVVENCAALPDTLLESELFGHTRGAFTGADRAKKGLIEQADGGTLFLDEIGDMSHEMQKKLLRVLQEGEVRPLGSNQKVQVDVRLLAASHRDLEGMVKGGEFREDLFYRINVLALRLPPLRERREDVPLLADALLARAAREAGKETPMLSHEVLAVLSAHEWPGNVRELENEMRRVLLLAEDSVRLEHLSPGVAEAAGGDGAGLTPAPEVVGDLRAAVARFEERAIDHALKRAAGNKSRAAKELGISRFALQRKLDKYAPAPRGPEDAPSPDESTPDPAGA